MAPQIAIDAEEVRQLLAEAPTAVDSFSAGHWDLMRRLERDAQSLITGDDVDAVISFLADVAVLKQPQRIDRQLVVNQLGAFREQVASTMAALSRVDELGYRAMDSLAHLPWFGRGGGRSFSSAVMRLLRPHAFGIIDWRNLAVLMGAPGFDGLVRPALALPEYSASEIVEHKGHLKLTQPLYERYNDTLRLLARSHNITAAEADLVLWTYSIRKMPFGSTNRPLAGAVFELSTEDRRLLKTSDRQAVTTRLLTSYVNRLKDWGVLSRTRAADELRSIFILVRNECESFARKKRGKLRERAARVVTSLDDAVAKRSESGLLAQWSSWQNMVEPSSPMWRGIGLPTSMVLEGYLILEDFIPVKEYFERLHDPGTMQPLSISD